MFCPTITYLNSSSLTKINLCSSAHLFYSINKAASKTEFFWGGPNRKVVAPGILVICPVDKNCDYNTKKWLFALNIQIFGSKKHIFAPSGQLVLHRSMFSTHKRCLMVPWYEGTKGFTPSPQKMDFGPKNSQIWPNTDIFGQLWAFLAHLIYCLSKKTMRTSCLGVFSIMWVPKLILTPVKLGFLAHKRPNLVQNMHFSSFWAKYWHFLPISSHARQKNQCEQGG